MSCIVWVSFLLLTSFAAVKDDTLLLLSYTQDSSIVFTDLWCFRCWL